MGAYGELFPGRKLRETGGQTGDGRQHDPGGPLDLEQGVVFLAAPDDSGATEPSTASDAAAGERTREDSATGGADEHD